MHSQALRLAEFLLNPRTQEGAELNAQTEAFINRMQLRIFSSPSLQEYQSDINIKKKGESGNFIVQLEFQRLPRDIITEVLRLIGAPSEPRVSSYVKNGAAKTGIEFDLDQDAFPDDKVSYGA